MSISPLNLELDVLSAALAKLGIDVPASQVLEVIKEEVDKTYAERQPKSMFVIISTVLRVRDFGRSIFPWTREANT